MLSPKKLLENARNRIAKTENWTKGALALDEYFTVDEVENMLDSGTLNEHMVMPTDPNAKCWCALGALSAEAGEVAEDPKDQFGLGRLGSSADIFWNQERWDRLPSNVQTAVIALMDAIHDSGFTRVWWDEKTRQSVWAFNDETTHENILTIFDRAIADMKGE